MSSMDPRVRKMTCAVRDRSVDVKKIAGVVDPGERAGEEVQPSRCSAAFPSLLMTSTPPRRRVDFPLECIGPRVVL